MLRLMKRRRKNQDMPLIVQRKPLTAFYVLPFVEITPSCLYHAVVSARTTRLQGLTSHIDNAAMMCLMPP
jgi:hypothetical protein